jgi:hypothetical protein
MGESEGGDQGGSIAMGQRGREAGATRGGKSRRGGGVEEGEDGGRLARARRRRGAWDVWQCVKHGM